ncbi:YebF family protein [Pectobacterium brasiliense]|uniref:YebF family protein n=1 Tax=Pectobacterium brasiliense TaxID=180957 RepID=UPI00057F99DC|nr:YebF family protein [Pectobacterium brasiliense]
MEWKTKAICCVLAAASALAGYDYYLRHSGPSCVEVTYEQAIDYVKHDLLTNRISRWAKFQPENLGTSTPVIAFDKAASPTLSDPEVYLLAFTVSGPQKTHSLFAMYECKTGSVEYASKDQRMN